MMRKLIGIVAGIILANLIIFGGEQLLLQMPFGTLVELDRPTQAGFVDSLPLDAQLWIVSGWLVGAFAGALLAFRVARWDFAGWIVAGCVAVIGIVNTTIAPQPLWMLLCAVANPFVGALIAFGVYRRLRAADLHLRR